MSKPQVNAVLVGRWGNQIFCYAMARGYAERHGFELHTNGWVGEQVFDLKDPRIEHEHPLRTEFDVVPGDGNITLRSYAMSQAAIDWYTREQVRNWFTFRPEILDTLQRMVPTYSVCGHLRHGDFLGNPGFVAVSVESYMAACFNFGISWKELRFVNESNPLEVAGLPVEVAHFLPDFYRLMMADTLFRANSSFSWWAATLGNASRVFAPDLTGIAAGGLTPVDVPFVAGNWPSISKQHPFCTDLHLKEQN